VKGTNNHPFFLDIQSLIVFSVTVDNISILSLIF
jgi:hypothetical protein